MLQPEHGGTAASKNIVIALDGTNNKLRSGVNTNVVRLFQLLDLSEPSKQVGYYDPGVGTFSRPSAGNPITRTLSRWSGLLFGSGLRQNLAEAYVFLMSVYEPGDRLFIFGFSRGAYTAKALVSLVDTVGIFRPGAENLVSYVVQEYTRQVPSEKDNKPKQNPASSAPVLSKDTPPQKIRRELRQDAYFDLLRKFAATFGRAWGGAGHHKDRAPVHFLGVWDTVNSTGKIWRRVRWAFVAKLPNVKVCRHAVSIDERRRPFRPHLCERHGKRTSERSGSPASIPTSGGCSRAQICRISR